MVKTKVRTRVMEVSNFTSVPLDATFVTPRKRRQAIGRSGKVYEEFLPGSLDFADENTMR
jgi:hypothetical protein